MNMKKALAGISAAAVAVSMLAVSSVSAYTDGADKIDFEDGDFSFVEMNISDGGDNSKLSLVTIGGSKRVKIDVQDNTLVPKVKVKLDGILGDRLADVNSIEVAISYENKDASAPAGWHGGALATVGSNDKPAWSQTDFSGQDDENNFFTLTATKKMLLPVSKFKADSQDPQIMIMSWAADGPYNMYIDDIKFLDKSGKAIPLVAAAAPAETEAADADASKDADAPAADAPVATEAPAADAPAADAPAATEAPVATEAPAADAPAATPAPATGNPVTAGAVAGVMLAAAAAAIAAKKRK